MRWLPVIHNDFNASVLQLLIYLRSLLWTFFSCNVPGIYYRKTQIETEPTSTWAAADKLHSVSIVVNMVVTHRVHNGYPDSFRYNTRGSGRVPPLFRNAYPGSRTYRGSRVSGYPDNIPGCFRVWKRTCVQERANTKQMPWSKWFSTRQHSRNSNFVLLSRLFFYQIWSEILESNLLLGEEVQNARFF